MTSNYHFKLKLLCTSIALLLTACGGSSDPVKPKVVKIPEVIAVDYQQVIDETVSDTIPGIVLLVESPENKFLGSAGIENTEDQNPMQVYHTMPTASAGKPMIGLLALMLADENLLDLDDTLDTWLPAELLSQIENSEEITLRQLLNHTSGIFNNTENVAYLELLITEPDRLKTDIDFVVFGLNQPAYFKPGEGKKYSNTGYQLAGLILDQVLGMHHSTALRERILEPLGMNATYYRGIEKDQGDFISGYHKFSDDETIYNTKAYQENVATASSPVVSSVEDMARFLKNAIADQSFIHDDIRADFIGEKQLNGIIGIDIVSDNTIYGHSGKIRGYHTQNVYIAEKDLSITAFINCSTDPVCENTMDNLIQKVLINELK
jgi:D-alanyl-D-alanine carboxypeptidase